MLRNSTGHKHGRVKPASYGHHVHGERAAWAASLLDAVPLGTVVTPRLHPYQSPAQPSF